MQNIFICFYFRRISHRIIVLFWFDSLKQVKRKVFNVNTDSQNCHGSRPADPRIVGGEKAKPGQFPYQVIFYLGPIA